MKSDDSNSNKLEMEGEKLELEDNTHDINTDNKLTKKYSSGATELLDNNKNKQLANKYGCLR